MFNFHFVCWYKNEINKLKNWVRILASIIITYFIIFFENNNNFFMLYNFYFKIFLIRSMVFKIKVKPLTTYNKIRKRLEISAFQNDPNFINILLNNNIN